jgi:hypothetical protein
VAAVGTASGVVSGSVAPRATMPAPAASLPPINGDFDRQAVIASVNGQLYTMGELEAAVRIAKVLGTLTGDAVPDFDSPDMPSFQVRMLKRQIDLMLTLQGAADKGIELPGEPVEDLVKDFLSRVGASEARLQDLMTQYGVTQDQVNRWFEDSTLSNMFVTQELMTDRDASEREVVTSQWLEAQWATHEDDILVSFYDPDTVMAGATPTPEAIPIDVMGPGASGTEASAVPTAKASGAGSAP